MASSWLHIQNPQHQQIHESDKDFSIRLNSVHSSNSITTGDSKGEYNKSYYNGIDNSYSLLLNITVFVDANDDLLDFKKGWNKAKTKELGFISILFDRDPLN